CWRPGQDASSPASRSSMRCTATWRLSPTGRSMCRWCHYGESFPLRTRRLGMISRPSAASGIASGSKPLRGAALTTLGEANTSGSVATLLVAAFLVLAVFVVILVLHHRALQQLRRGAERF